jgi:hypothetical protein
MVEVTVANTLSYYDTATITTVNSFIVQGQGEIEKNSKKDKKS